MLIPTNTQHQERAASFFFYKHSDAKIHPKSLKTWASWCLLIIIITIIMMIPRYTHHVIWRRVDPPNPCYSLCYRWNAMLWWLHRWWWGWQRFQFNSCSGRQTSRCFVPFLTWLTRSRRIQRYFMLGNNSPHSKIISCSVIKSSRSHDLLLLSIMSHDSWPSSPSWTSSPALPAPNVDSPPLLLRPPSSTGSRGSFCCCC